MTTTENMVECDWCPNVFNPDEAEMDGDICSSSLCIDCQDNASICYDCGATVHSDSTYWSGDTPICQRCCNRYYSWCDPCGEYWHHDGPCQHQEDEYDDNDGGVIHQYSYMPDLKWLVKEVETNSIVKTSRTDFIRDAPFMGFELEIEVQRNKYEIAENLLEKINSWAYLKEDGSLVNGFEIVSHPHTMSAYNLRDWEWLNWLKTQKATSWDSDTCGLHIHINKSAFANSGHIWRFTNLVLYNRNEAARLAGRRDSRWASFSREYKQVGKILKGELSPERYSAVNLCPYRTIEVRMFRGSLHEPRLRSALEFVNANFEYTKPLTSHDVLKNDAMSWWSFTDWVQSNQSTYPHLNHYLTKIKERLKVDVSTML